MITWRELLFGIRAIHSCALLWMHFCNQILSPAILKPQTATVLLIMSIPWAISVSPSREFSSCWQREQTQTKAQRPGEGGSLMFCVCLWTSQSNCSPVQGAAHWRVLKRGWWQTGWAQGAWLTWGDDRLIKHKRFGEISLFTWHGAKCSLSLLFLQCLTRSTEITVR